MLPVVLFVGVLVVVPDLVSRPPAQADGSIILDANGLYKNAAGQVIQLSSTNVGALAGSSCVGHSVAEDGSAHAGNDLIVTSVGGSGSLTFIDVEHPFKQVASLSLIHI